jgi:hypothetical protein
MSRGRTYISGTGRAGTTFLISLLTEIGLDTGFSSAEGYGSYYETARAGLEKDIFDRDGPAIIKSPYLCDHLDEIIALGMSVSHIIIPVRNFQDAAKSREFVQKETTGWRSGRSVAGGLWGTTKSADQTVVLREKFTNLIEAAVRNEIPMTFLSFPRLATDCDYLYERLAFLFGDVTRDAFTAAFDKISRPDLIHDFSSGDAKPSQT